ncbi:Uncharacterised protein [Bacillus freudenreichii]|nr:Uncharacterised protein [Bacillus freudenreichii]
MHIGFELMTQRTWTILPGASFTIFILWDSEKIPLSIGKDVFHVAGTILPDKILTGTGRFHHSSEGLINRFEPLQSKPCRLVSCPKDPPAALHLEVSVPKAELVDTIYQTTFIKMWIRKNSRVDSAILYFDPNSVQNIRKNRFLVDLTHTLKRSISSH